MPVVNDDWSSPGRWAPAKVAWGVTRDGDQLRFCRLTTRGRTSCWMVSPEEFLAGAEPAERLRLDLRGGARLVAGLPPSVALLRTLESPFSDPGKTREIRDSLLDAALPFSLEDCVTSFLPSQSRDESIRLPAIAARLADLKNTLKTWSDLGLDPELLVPEALLLPAGGNRACVWIGEHRTLFAREAKEGGLVCGGASGVARDGRALSRFFASADEAPEIQWIGPGGDSEPDFLERLLARAGLGMEPLGLNLRADVLAHPRLAKRHRGMLRRWGGVAAGIFLLAAVSPWGIRAAYARRLAQLDRQVAEVFHETTGFRSPAPGWERLLLERHAEEAWGAVSDARESLVSSTVATELADLLLAAQFTGVSVRSLRVADEELAIEIQAPEPAANAMESRLRGLRPGVSWSREALEDERWRFVAEEGP